MPKIRTNRGAAKRFKKTASGNYKCKQSHLNHLLTKKSSGRKRSLRAPDTVDKVDVPMLKKYYHIVRRYYAKSSEGSSCPQKTQKNFR